jgi:hypothetical protein
MQSQLTQLACFFAALAISCSKPHHDVPAASPLAAELAVKAGDRVVIESTSAMFVEGRIVSVTRERAQLALVPSGESRDQLITDLYVPGESDDPPMSPATGFVDATFVRGPLHEGSFAVCRTGEARWRGCRIESITTQVRAVDDDGVSIDLAWHDILAPTPVTELNLRQRFERNAKRRAFRDGARSAGRPRTPLNWRPALNERVIATRDGVWVGAQVKDLKKGIVRLQWDGDRRVAETPVTDVAPQPPVEFAPMAGTFVLVRPPTGNRAWSVMRVEYAGSLNLVLSDELGDRHEMTTRDVLPLERTGS